MPQLTMTASTSFIAFIVSNKIGFSRFGIALSSLVILLFGRGDANGSSIANRIGNCREFIFLIVQ